MEGRPAALLALSLAVPACAAPVDGETAAARKEDLEFLYQTLERAHPDLFANTPRSGSWSGKVAIETGLEEAGTTSPLPLELQSAHCPGRGLHIPPWPGWEHEPDGPRSPHVPLQPGRPLVPSAAPSRAPGAAGREARRRQRQEYGGDGGGLWGGAQSVDNGVKLRRQYRQSCKVVEFYEYLGSWPRAGDPLATLAGAEGRWHWLLSRRREAGPGWDLGRPSDELPQPVTGVQDRFSSGLPPDEGTYDIQYNSCRGGSGAAHGDLRRPGATGPVGGAVPAGVVVTCGTTGGRLRRGPPGPAPGACAGRWTGD